MRSHYSEGGFHFFRRPFPPVCQPLLRSLWDHGMKHLAACGSRKATAGALQAQGLKCNPTESFPRPAGPVQRSARWHFLNWVLPVEMEMFIHFWKAVSLHWTPPHQTCHKLKKNISREAKFLSLSRNSPEIWASILLLCGAIHCKSEKPSHPSHV